MSNEARNFWGAQSLIHHSYSLSQVKIFIYMVMAAVEEEETQKRGMVGLFYFVGATSFMFDRKFVQVNNLLSGLLNCLPCKLTAMHICFNDPRLRMIKALIMLTMGRDRRVRLRVHIGACVRHRECLDLKSCLCLIVVSFFRLFAGTHMECQYSLMTFGMPVPFIPVTDAGDVKATNHMKWIAKRKIKESFLKRAQPFEGINLPSNNDVLVGRGKPIGESDELVIAWGVLHIKLNHDALLNRRSRG